MSNDMQYIALDEVSSRAVRRSMGALGASIEAGLENAGESIEAGLKSIARSNITASKEIAKAQEKTGKLSAKSVLKAGQLIQSGLCSVADEIRRKTYMDEYYLLLDRIDSLEDKIVAKGGKLQEIYGGLETEYVPPIVLSFAEILTMNYCIDKETMEWFRTVVSTYKVSPWNFFINILEECKGKHHNIGYDIVDVAYYSQLDIPIYYKGCRSKETMIKIVGDCRYLRFNDEENMKIKEWVLAKKKQYDELQCLSKWQLDTVNEFNTFINSINVEIMMENLRLLHTRLREVYRQMK